MRDRSRHISPPTHYSTARHFLPSLWQAPESLPANEVFNLSALAPLVRAMSWHQFRRARTSSVAAAAVVLPSDDDALTFTVLRRRSQLRPLRLASPPLPSLLAAARTLHRSDGCEDGRANVSDCYREPESGLCALKTQWIMRG